MGSRRVLVGFVCAVAGVVAGCGDDSNGWQGRDDAIGSLESDLPPPNADCEAVDAWIRAHADLLPMDHAALRRFAPEHQRRVFDALPAEVKADIALEHLSLARTTEHWVPAQVERIEQLEASISPAIYQQESAEAGRAIIQAWVAEGRAWFSADELRALADLFDGPVMAMGGSLSDCGCSTQNDWCGSGFYCRNNGCRQSSWGCGWFGAWGCDGICYLLNWHPAAPG